jgi:hypothetical protein
MPLVRLCRRSQRAAARGKRGEPVLCCSFSKETARRRHTDLSRPRATTRGSRLEGVSPELCGCLPEDPEPLTYGSSRLSCRRCYIGSARPVKSLPFRPLADFRCADAEVPHAVIGRAKQAGPLQHTRFRPPLDRLRHRSLSPQKAGQVPTYRANGVFAPRFSLCEGAAGTTVEHSHYITNRVFLSSRRADSGWIRAWPGSIEAHGPGVFGGC